MKKETVETRLDNIEEILKMLLVSSVLGSSDVDKIQENILCQFRDALSGLGIYPESVNLGSQFIAEARCFTAFLAL